MKPLVFALLVVALHLAIAAASASRSPTAAPASFALITAPPR